MTRTAVVRKATDLTHAAQLLVEAAEPEGYRAVAVHPLFQSAEAGYEGPEAVLIELDAPRLNRAFLETRLESALLLPVRVLLFVRDGRTRMSVQNVQVYREALEPLTPRPSACWTGSRSPRKSSSIGLADSVGSNLRRGRLMLCIMPCPKSPQVYRGHTPNIPLLEFAKPELDGTQVYSDLERRLEKLEKSPDPV